ncbi:Uncharacterised protein [Mycobacteroides abscessus subsp. abscessus]|nr:Uncharacterised protein [Mycobacteroides abscessus subsp. abscessus]
MARCTKAAATAESTPPDNAHSARPSPICVRTCSTSVSAILAAVHADSIPANSCRKRLSTCCPCGECSTSGWYCTPASRRSRFSNAATGAPSLLATTVKPCGASVTASPWLIHTGCTSGRPSCRSPPATVSSVRPYSLVPVCATVPPSTCAMAWKP